MFFALVSASAYGAERIVFVGDSITGQSRNSADGYANVIDAAFAATIADYNEACEKGIDEAFGKKPQYLRPIAQAPFYAIPLATGTMGSAGGIRVNGDMQVLNADYEPIPGLYAVGLDATGLYGDSYNMEVPGAANGFAHTSGRIAARHAIAQMD